MIVVNISFILHILITDKLIWACQFSGVQWTGGYVDLDLLNTPRKLLHVAVHTDVVNIH